jgi:hypothetical protein
MIELLLILIFIWLVAIAWRIHRSNRVLEKILKEVSGTEDHLRAMRKYYEPQPPPLTLDPESEPQRESLRQGIGQ